MQELILASCQRTPAKERASSESSTTIKQRRSATLSTTREPVETPIALTPRNYAKNNVDSRLLVFPYRTTFARIVTLSLAFPQTFALWTWMLVLVLPRELRNVSGTTPRRASARSSSTRWKVATRTTSRTRRNARRPAWLASSNNYLYFTYLSILCRVNLPEYLNNYTRMDHDDDSGMKGNELMLITTPS